MIAASFRRILLCLVVLPAFVSQSWAQEPPQRIWASADYLLWWVKGADLPPLVTTAPIDESDASARPGKLGQPGTTVLLGNDTLGFGPSSGGRLTLGGWIDGEQRTGIEGSYVFLTTNNVSRTLSAPGTPGSIPLLIPFFNPLTGIEDSTGIAIPAGDGFSGVANLHLSTTMRTAEINGLYNVLNRPGARVEVLAGYRRLNLNEDLTFATDSQSVPPLPPDIFRTADSFQTRNEFNGGQLGIRSKRERGRGSLDASEKVAFGSMRQSTAINGVLETNDFDNIGPAQNFPGGYLTLPTNIGNYQRRRFALVPETNLQVSWKLTRQFKLVAGYSFIFVSSAARPADQIDRTINPSQAPAINSDPSEVLTGPARPAYLGRDTSFWAQGINFGANFHF